MCGPRARGNLASCRVLHGPTGEAARIGARGCARLDAAGRPDAIVTGISLTAAGLPMLRPLPMRGGTWALALAAGLSLCAVRSAPAVIFGGGGSTKADCLLVFDGPLNDPETRPKKIRCTDGESSSDSPCDADGTVDGVCTFEIRVCANSTFDPLRCTLNGVNSVAVDHALDNGDPKFDVDFQALQSRINGTIEPPTTSPDRCITPVMIRVPIQGPFPGDVCKGAKKQIKIVTLSTPQMGKIVKDTDKLKLTCDPPVPCAPGKIFANTFDRIQRQIFNRNCALSGCHDSQTQAGEMLLESSGSYSNIVNHLPRNPVAAGLGWRRIDAANASPETSYMYHKLTGDLPDDLLGARMPFGRGKLDQFLIDILRLWIEAGAPNSGWVPGTD